jgi:hypothetical protein
LRASPVAALAAAIACSASTASDDDEGASAIYGGKASGPQDDAVVYILAQTAPNSGSACTGALVAPNLVLTALHCVAPSVSSGVACDSNGLSGNGDHVGQSYSPSIFTISVGAQRNKGTAKVKEVIRPNTFRLCNADIAFLVLDRSIPNIQPLKVRYKTPVTTSDQVRSVGYGRNNTGVATGTRLERAGVSVLAAGPNTSQNGVSVAAREFEVTNGLCSGDSGGPAINAKTGAVLGVASRVVDCNFNYGGIYTMAYNFPVTFGRAMTAAGATIVDESDGMDGGASDASSDASLDATSDASSDASADATTEAGAVDAGPADAGEDASDAGPTMPAPEPSQPNDGGMSDGGSSKNEPGGTPEDDLDHGENDDEVETRPKPRGTKVPNSEDSEDSEGSGKVRVQTLRNQGCSTSRLPSPGGAGAVGLGLGLTAVMMRRRRRSQ